MNDSERSLLSRLVTRGKRDTDREGEKQTDKEGRRWGEERQTVHNHFM